MRTDGRTDMMKLNVACCNFANGPKNVSHKINDSENFNTLSGV